MTRYFTRYGRLVDDVALLAAYATLIFIATIILYVVIPYLLPPPAATSSAGFGMPKIALRAEAARRQASFMIGDR